MDQTRPSRLRLLEIKRQHVGRSIGRSIVKIFPPPLLHFGINIWRRCVTRLSLSLFLSVERGSKKDGWQSPKIPYPFVGIEHRPYRDSLLPLSMDGKKRKKSERGRCSSDAISPVADFPTHPPTFSPLPSLLTTTGTQLSMIYNL